MMEVMHHMNSFIQNGSMPKSYHYFGYCLLFLSEAEMPSEERERQRERDREREREKHISTGLATKKPNSR